MEVAAAGVTHQSSRVRRGWTTTSVKKKVGISSEGRVQKRRKDLKRRLLESEEGSRVSPMDEATRKESQNYLPEQSGGGTNDYFSTLVLRQWSSAMAAETLVMPTLHRTIRMFVFRELRRGPNTPLVPSGTTGQSVPWFDRFSHVGRTAGIFFNRHSLSISSYCNTVDHPSKIGGRRIHRALYCKESRVSH